MTGIEVRWTTEAEITFDQIVSYILEHWGENARQKFISHTEEVLSVLITQPEMYGRAGIGNVRRAVITKQTSLFYDLQNNFIVLLYFWDNRQDPLFT
ncbi:MAG: type II toxin-antitoxin system RelE/ParE family toxin [Mucilaginibacter polytrichastri]|nr:type II toxin-antitoxin system RelE/ParE family toxin [Mucilaginibacter polytrichastri]